MLNEIIDSTWAIIAVLIIAAFIGTIGWNCVENYLEKRKKRRDIWGNDLEGEDTTADHSGQEPWI